MAVPPEFDYASWHAVSKAVQTHAAKLARSFMDPIATGEYDEKRGWCPPDVAAHSVAPSRAKLTCDRNGLDDPSRNNLKPILRPGERAYLTLRPSDAVDATAYMAVRVQSREIAKLKERVAILEADNKVLEDRKDALLNQYSAASTVAMRLSARVLKLQAEVDALKRTQSQHPVESSPVPPDSTPVPVNIRLDEPANPSQEAIWRNATRFSR